MVIVTEQATEIQENAEVPAMKFLVPEGVTFPYSDVNSRLLSFLFRQRILFFITGKRIALERVLREAGDNRMELEKVLAYYR